MGLALTPDASELLAANFLDDSVAVISPDSPGTASAAQIVPPGTFQSPVPAQIATTSLNTAFVDTGDTSGITGGGGQVYILDLGTLQAALDTDPGLSFIEFSGAWINSSNDGSQAIITNPDGGPAIIWNAASNHWTPQSGGTLVDGTVSSDDNMFATVGTGRTAFPISVAFIDPQANIIGYIGLPDFLLKMLPLPGPASPTTLTGARLNSSGSLLYVPFAHGIDIFDVHHGNLRERISLTEQMSNGGGPLGDLTNRIVHNMAIDETGKRLFLITDKGLTIAQLDSLPLSIGSVTPALGAPGAQVTVRGSGFVQGATANANSCLLPSATLTPALSISPCPPCRQGQSSSKSPTRTGKITPSMMHTPFNETETSLQEHWQESEDRSWKVEGSADCADYAEENLRSAKQYRSLEMMQNRTFESFGGKP